MGYAREMVLAAELGAGTEVDAYRAAFQIPDILNYFLAGGAFTIAFAMALLYLLRSHLPRAMAWAPELGELDLYTHRAIQFGWPLLGIGIVLGAVWADTAWGRMWSWDPKEVLSLVVWLVYAVFLHARLVRGLRGMPAAAISIVGFLLTVFTIFGTMVFGGLHSYG